MPESFKIYPKTTTELNLDFDVSKSVIEKGDQDPWILKPTVKVFDDHEKAIIRGKVTDSTTTLGIPGVLVSIQNYSAGATELKDSVIVHTSTLTSSEPGSEGDFSIFVEPGSPYNLVAYKDGYHPDFGTVQALGEMDVLEDQNFILKSASVTGTLNGKILISGLGPNEESPWATLSFRQQIECGTSANPEMVELKSLNVEAGTTYSELLPVIPTPDPDQPCGNYQLVVSSHERGTENKTPLIVNSGINHVEDISLLE